MEEKESCLMSGLDDSIPPLLAGKKLRLVVHC